MIFEVEFLCFDERPLRTHNDGVLPYLSKFQQNNTAIESQENKKLYYRSVGILNTKKKSHGDFNPAFFKTHNSIKFLSFEKHLLDSFASDKYNLHRGDRVRRYFCTSDYGVINRLKLGFEFWFEVKKDRINESFDEQKQAYNFIDFVLKMEVNTKNQKLSIYELGEKWLPQIIKASTKLKEYSEKKDDEKIVKYLGVTAVVICEKGELQELPVIRKEFCVTHCPKSNMKVRVFYYDHNVYPNTIRVYLIEYDKGCSTDFLHGLKSHLLSLRTNFICLEHALCHMDVVDKKHTTFWRKLRNNIHMIRDSKYGFINLKDQDFGEICHRDTRNKINKKLMPYFTDVYGF
jgi:hypothetical protein